MISDSQISAVADNAPRRLRSAHGVIRALLFAAAISLIVGPILLALRLHENDLEVGTRHGTPPAIVSSHDASRWRSVGIGLPADSAPVVLAYRDIRPAKPVRGRVVGRATGVYNVTPEQFDRQLTMLQDAGFRSVTAAEYIAYLHGRALPSRSVLITFDGATQGLWSFADQILARHHMHGVSFLNTRTIETHWTRYLSWPEIQRMQATRRWEFESALSRDSLTSQADTVASDVAATLRASTESFQHRKLPLPRLLAWAITVPGAGPRPERPIDVAQVVQAPFVAAFADDETPARSTSRSTGARKVIGRIVVARTTGADTLLESIASVVRDHAGVSARLRELARLPNTNAPRAGKTLFAPRFASSTRLITNDYAYFNGGSPRAVHSADWLVTSGSLFSYHGAGWTGIPDSAKSNADSTNGTGSATFRMVTRRRDFGSVAVSFDLLNQRTVTTPKTPAHSWDGVHLFLHYRSQHSLYVLTINRRDNVVVVKKKRPGGSANGGTYYTLGAPVSYTPRHGHWQHVLATVKANADHTVTITASLNGRLLVTVTDKGIGGRPLAYPGAIGIRGDNTEFEFANFRVRQLR